VMTGRRRDRATPDVAEQLAADVAPWPDLAVRAARDFGTPCYVSRWNPVKRAVEEQEARFPGQRVRSWLSFKTHPVRPLAQSWLQSGRGVEVVSEAEFVAVKSLVIRSDQLLVNGVAKHSWLARYQVPGLRVHIDSLTELVALLPAAAEQRWHVGLRCQVPMERDARDSRFRGQFGLDEAEVARASLVLAAMRIHIRGMHFHLGQAVRQLGSYAASFAYIASLCVRYGLAPDYIDCGGGIDGSVDLDAAFADTAAGFARAVEEVPSLQELWLENGRYLTRAAAALVVRVLDRKVRDDSHYLICDGGRTNHALDADNGMHPVFVLPERSGRRVLTTVCGPTCMTDDRLGRVMLSNEVEPGDVLVWLDAGAYHLPWETRFSHGLCTSVWADEGERLTEARRRETPEQWSQR
jgi:diaminopimelate decarboxylase